MPRAARPQPGWLLSLLGAAVLVAGGFVVGLVVGVVSEEPELVVGHFAGRSEEAPWQEQAAEGEDAFAGGPYAEEPLPADPAGDAVLGARPPLGRRPPRNDSLALSGGEGFDGVEIDLPSLGPESPAEAGLPPVAAPPAETTPRTAGRGAVAIDDLPSVAVREAATQDARQSAASGYAVQVGAFSDAAAAARVRDDLRGKGFDAYVVPSASSGDGRTRVRVGPVASKVDAQAVADRLKREERLPTWVLAESEG